MKVYIVHRAGSHKPSVVMAALADAEKYAAAFPGQLSITMWVVSKIDEDGKVVAA